MRPAAPPRTPSPNPQRLVALALMLGWLAVAAALIWRDRAAWVAPWLLTALLVNPIGLALCGLLAAPKAGLRWPVAVRAWWREVGLMPRVFAWEQPWRADAHPDFVPRADRPGVVLVHGLFCNRGFWNHWLGALRNRDTPFVAVTLTPMLGDIDGYVATIDEAVARVTAATGRPPLLVGHSMGGIAIRAWLRAKGGDARMRGVVTLGSPHQGTWLARLPLPGRNVRQMRQGSAWLAELAASEPAARRARFVCVDSDADQIVFPPGVARLPGAPSQRWGGVPHVALAHEPRAWQLVLEQLDG